DEGDGLAPPLREKGVECVLHRTGNGMVVLRRNEDESVTSVNGMTPGRHTLVLVFALRQRRQNVSAQYRQIELAQVDDLVVSGAAAGLRERPLPHCSAKSLLANRSDDDSDSHYIPLLLDATDPIMRCPRAGRPPAIAPPPDRPSCHRD